MNRPADRLDAVALTLIALAAAWSFALSCAIVALILLAVQP